MQIWYRCGCCNKKIIIIENLERGDKWTNHDWKDLNDFLNCLQEQVLKLEGGNELNVDPDDFNDNLIPKHAFNKMLSHDPDFVPPPNYNEKFPGNLKMEIKDMPRANWPKEFILKWVPESHDLAKAYMKWLKEMIKKGFDPTVKLQGGKGASAGANPQNRFIFTCLLDWRGYGSVVIKEKQFTDYKGQKENVGFVEFEIAENEEEKYKDLLKADATFEISWIKPEQAEIEKEEYEDDDTGETETYFSLIIKGKYEIKSINWHNYEQPSNHQEPSAQKEKEKPEIFNIGKPKKVEITFYGFEIKLDKPIKFYDKNIEKQRDFAYIMLPEKCAATEIMDEQMNGAKKGQGIKGYKIEGIIERLTNDTIKLKEVVDLETLETDWQPATINFPSAQFIPDTTEEHEPGLTERIVFMPLRVENKDNGEYEIVANYAITYKDNEYRNLRFKNNQMASYLMNFLESHKNEQHWFKIVGEVLNAKNDIIRMRRIDDLEELQTTEYEFGDTTEAIHATPQPTEPAMPHTATAYEMDLIDGINELNYSGIKYSDAVNYTPKFTMYLSLMMSSPAPATRADLLNTKEARNYGNVRKFEAYSDDPRGKTPPE